MHDHGKMKEHKKILYNEYWKRYYILYIFDCANIDIRNNNKIAKQISAYHRIDHQYVPREVFSSCF